MSEIPNAWQDNTPENPFWKSDKPVTVLRKDGRKMFLSCPKCAKIMNNSVVKWRVVEKIRNVPI